MIKTNGFRVLAMVMTTLWMVTIIPVTVVQAADFRGQGFDLSSYNGTVNWEQVAEADMDFVMIRTGEGRAPDVDTQFAANYDGAVAAGLKVGVYHVCCVRTPKEAVEEAEYCLEILDGRDLDYPVAGYVPMIYSSASFLNENFDWKKLKNCKVWVASYSDTRPKLPVSADLWQYTKKGSLEGANTDKGYCDLVYSYMEATSIKFTKPTLTMKKNTTAQATVKMGPNGCTDRKSFTSSNPKVVAVNKKTGKLTAKKAGKATITVTTGSGRKAKMKVVVK